jgi:hypothetical protein
MSTTFKAPWGRELVVMSIAGSLVFGVPIVIQGARGFWVVPAMMLSILTIILLQCVRGYEVSGGELRIRRLLWDTRWPLGPGAKAAVRPHAMTGSWRKWGNGGLFAITGGFSGSGLGRYHAFVTDPARTVVVSTDRGIVVVSPDRPADFAAAVERLRYSPAEH